MTTSPQLVRVERRPRRLVLVVALVLVLGATGTAVYVGTRRSVAPPTISFEGIDPDVASAISVARTKVVEDPDSADAWGLLGKVLLANGLDNEADVCFRHAEKRDGKNPRWPYYRAVATGQADTEETIASFRRAIDACDRSEPEVVAPRMQLATLLIQEGRDEEAEGVVEVLKARLPDDPQTIFLSAILLANRNDLSGSAALLRGLTENPTTRQKACTKLAQIQLRLGDTKSARTWEKMARALPADNPFPDPYAAEIRQLWVGRKQRLGEVSRLQEQQRYAEAVALLQVMVANHEKDFAQAHVDLGNNLVHLARGPEAEQAYENALRLSPDDPETYTRLALVRLYQGEVFGDREGARRHYRRALESARIAVRLAPENGESQLVLGQILLALGERPEGVAVLKTCLRSRPEMVNAHLLLGKALAEAGQMGEARSHLEDAIRFADPKDERPREALERFEKNQAKKSAVP